MRHIGLFGIHILTASGAALSLFAMVAAMQDNWRLAFFWLGAALIVDGIDGPIARHFKVGEALPRWNGAALDFVIDYTSYVFVPALIIARGTGLSVEWGAIAGAIVAITGALYFADTRMKLPDCSFRGFPAAWNMAIFVIFVMSPPATISLAIVITLAVLTFSPIQFVHPLRVVRWRTTTLIVTAAWAFSALWLVVFDFADGPLARFVLVGASLYLMVVSAAQQLISACRG